MKFTIKSENFGTFGKAMLAIAALFTGSLICQGGPEIVSATVGLLGISGWCATALLNIVIYTAFFLASAVACIVAVPVTLNILYYTFVWPVKRYRIWRRSRHGG